LGLRGRRRWGLRGYGLLCTSRWSCAAGEPALELFDSLHRSLELVAKRGRLSRVSEVEQDQDGQTDKRGEARVSAGRREEVCDRKSVGEVHFRLA
jgi:hypothetical protein